MQEADRWPDKLTGWLLPPGEVEPVRVFESAEAAMMFLARQSAVDPASGVRFRPGRFGGSERAASDESRRASGHSNA